MAVIYFGGCSITLGTGFEKEQLDPRIYPNQVTSEAINDAGGGSSNLKIFTKAAKAIVEDTAEAYVVQWSGLHRHWLYPKPDSGIYIGASYEKSDDFVAQYQLRNHDYGNILQLIDFTRILSDLADKHNSQIIFVNGMVIWENNIEWMYQLVSDADSDHDRFVENLQNNMELVDWSQWINPWHNMNDYKLDNAPLDEHPGPQTHKQIADLILEKLNERI